MKKIIFLLSFIVLYIVFQANTQLNVTTKIEKELEAVCTLRMQYSWLKWNSDLGYFITAKTGGSEIATLKDIIALIENQVTLTIVQHSG